MFEFVNNVFRVMAYGGVVRQQRAFFVAMLLVRPPQDKMISEHNLLPLAKFVDESPPAAAPE
jgi:hypothetical protein